MKYNNNNICIYIPKQYPVERRNFVLNSKQSFLSYKIRKLEVPVTNDIYLSVLLRQSTLVPQSSYITSLQPVPVHFLS